MTWQKLYRSALRQRRAEPSPPQFRGHSRGVNARAGRGGAEFDDERARQCRLCGAERARRRRIDSLDMLRRAVARGGPQRAALPAGVRIVDAAFEPFAEKPHRIGYAQFDKMAVDERVQRIRLVAGFERHVWPEPQDVEPIDPDVTGILLPGSPWKPARTPDRTKSPRGISRPSRRPAR